MSGGDDDLGVGGVGRTKATDTGPSGVDGVGNDADGTSVQGVAPTGAVDAATADLQIADDLSAGRIESHQALERLIDETLRAQLPADASPELQAALRAEIADLLADDPTIQALLEGS